LTTELRNIELLVQQRSAAEGIVDEERDNLAKIQEILYSTAEGFEVSVALVPDHSQKLSAMITYANSDNNADLSFRKRAPKANSPMRKRRLSRRIDEAECPLG